MRFVATMLLWLAATVALAVAVPTAWAQKNIVDVNGYSEFAASAAKDPALQRAMAGELTTQVTRMSEGRLSADLARGVATAYTASPSFPGQFAQANHIAHRWLFSDRVATDAEGRWVVDLAPMLADSSFQQTLANFNVSVPSTLTVTVTVSENLRPGQLPPLATWGPWVSDTTGGIRAVAVLTPHMRAAGASVAAHGDQQGRWPPPERFVRKLAGDAVTRDALLAATATPRVVVGDPARQKRPIGSQALSGHLQPELIEAAERRQIRAREGSVRHVEVFQRAV